MNRLGRVLVISIITLLLFIIAILLVFLIRNAQKADLAQSELITLATQKQGLPGLDGKDATPEMVAAAVQAYCDTHNHCAGPTGPAGATAGISGPAGASVAKVTCHGDHISFYDSTGKDIGDISLVCIQ